MSRKVVKGVPAIVPKLSQALRRRRLLQQMTLDSVSKRTKLSVGYLSAIELGRHQPSLDVLSRLCDVLGLTLTQLFALSEVQDELQRIETDTLIRYAPNPS